MLVNSNNEVYMDKIEQKRQKEMKVVNEMIALYCRKNHKVQYKENHGMCLECYTLSQYAQQRSAHCPRMETKTFCANCKIHCYKPEMREKIRTVMRFSGPRMLLYHPCMAIWHVMTTIQEKRKTND